MQFRSKHLSRHSRSDELSVRCGIVAGTLEQYAHALNTTQDGVCVAVRRAGIEPMVDTATAVSSRETHDRPTEPALRSLAMTRADFARLTAAVCDNSDPVPAAGMNEENPPTNPPLTMPDQRKSRDIRVRMEPQLHDKVQRAANRESRSLSGYVRHILQRHLAIEQRVYGQAKEAA